MVKKKVLTLSILSFVSALLLTGFFSKNQDNINITKNIDKTEINNQVLEQKKENQNLNLFLILSFSIHFIFLITIVIAFIALRSHKEAIKKMNKGINTAFEKSKNDIKDLQYNIQEIKAKIKRRDEKISLIRADLDKLKKKDDDISFNTLINQLDANFDDSFLPIYNKFQEIDKQIKDLEKASQKIIISGGKSNPQPKAINLTEDELINIYNYAPQVLAEYATPVSISVENYKNKNQENIYLEYTVNGFYWVILREENHEKNYYLVPNGNKKFNLHRLQDLLEKLFIIRGEKDTNNNHFSLEKLTSIEILPSGSVWQLSNRGIIKIGAISSINKLLRDLEKINTQSGEVPDNIKKLLSLVYENYQNSNLIKEEQKKLEKDVNEISKKLIEFETTYVILQVQSPKKNIPTPPYNPNNPNYYQDEDSLRASLRDSYNNQPIQFPPNNLQETEFNNSNEQIDNNIHQESENILLAKEYNQDKNNLLSSSVVVTLTEESANKIFRQIWIGSIEFENNKHGEFFVIEGSHGEYYLFPCRNKNIDLRTIKNARLFTIIGDDEGIAKGENILVNNPAKVEKNGQYWRLLEEGEIKLS